MLLIHCYTTYAMVLLLNTESIFIVTIKHLGARISIGIVLQLSLVRYLVTHGEWCLLPAEDMLKTEYLRKVAGDYLLLQGIGKTTHKYDSIFLQLLGVLII